MELFGHVGMFYYALRMAGISKARTNRLILEHSAKLCLTDAIRWTVRSMEDSNEVSVLKSARGYSHYTDGCWMKLPYGEALKTFTNIHQTEFFAPQGYRIKIAADKPTDFPLFIRVNSEMFEPENEIWGLSVLAHLQQDVSSDTVWLYDLCHCHTDTNEATYLKSGKRVTAEQFRQDMARANIIVHKEFINKIFMETGDVIDQNWLDLVSQSFYNQYDCGMAENTSKGLNTNMDYVFTKNNEDEIFETLRENGLISERSDLYKEIDLMINNTLGCFSAIINKLAR